MLHYGKNIWLILKILNFAIHEIGIKILLGIKLPCFSRRKDKVIMTSHEQ